MSIIDKALKWWEEWKWRSEILKFAGPISEDMVHAIRRLPSGKLVYGGKCKRNGYTSDSGSAANAMFLGLNGFENKEVIGVWRDGRNVIAAKYAKPFFPEPKSL